MDSFKEKDKLAPKPSKRPCIEAAEELMRQMIAGQAPLDSKVVRQIPEPEEEDTDGTYYGSYFDDHDVLVQVFFYDKEGETDTYLVNDTVKAGEQRALVAQN